MSGLNIGSTFKYSCSIRNWNLSYKLGRSR